MAGINKAIAVFERTESMLDTTCKVIATFNANTDLSMVSIYKEELEKTYHEFYDAYETLEAVMTGKKDDELKVHLASFGAGHENFITAKIKIAQCLTAAANTNGARADLNQSIVHEAAPPNFKLPPIKIRTFKGNLEDWPEFKATCNSVFTDAIPEVQRLQYLKDVLVDEPLELVRHITPYEGAFNAAWMILKNRYDNTRAIVYACFARFFDLPQLQTESADGLKYMLNVTNHTLAVIKGYQIAVSTWDPILVFILSRKLDNESLKH